MKKLTLLLIIFVVAAVGCADRGEESPQKTVAQTETPCKTADGNVAVTFVVTVPKWTPEEDIIYVYIDGHYHPPRGGVPMDRKTQYVWTTTVTVSPNQQLTYKYNRNNYGFAIDEEFSPDSKDARRSIDVAEKSQYIHDEVEKWRWLSEEPPTVDLSSFIPSETPQREEQFVIGMGMLDYFDEIFIEHVPSTFDRIKEKGFDYVSITYAPSFFVGGNPLKFSHDALNTYTEEELTYVISEARKRDLKILLSAGVETDPGHMEIEEVFSKYQSDEWYRRLANEWETVMVETAIFAEKHDIEIFSPSEQWFGWGDKTEDQKKLVNQLVNNAYEHIREVYSGTITTDYYNSDEAYDYHKQMDWVGDKWWWPLAGTKETSLSEMIDAAQQIVDEIYQPIAERYNKPIFLQQLAYASYDGAAGALQLSTEGSEVAEWYPYNPAFPTDFQEQADAYEAVFQAIYDEQIFTGVFSFGYMYWDMHDKSAGIRGKPAEHTWRKWNRFFTNE